MKRLLVSIIAAVALAVSSIGAVAAAPPAAASCAAHLITGPLGPPGQVQREVHDPRLGGTVAHMARFPGSSFGECFDEFLRFTAGH